MQRKATSIRKILKQSRLAEKDKVKAVVASYKASPSVVTLSAYNGEQVAFLPPTNGIISDLTISENPHLEAVIVGVGEGISASVIKNPDGTWPESTMDGVTINRGELIFADFQYSEGDGPTEVHISFLFYTTPKHHKSFADAETDS
jgi:hypothetical protein